VGSGNVQRGRFKFLAKEVGVSSIKLFTSTFRAIAPWLLVHVCLTAEPPPSSPEAVAAAQVVAPATPETDAHKWPGQGDPNVERVRKCLLKRESEGQYAVVDPLKRWFGGYQFAMITSNTAARRMQRPDLVGIPANKWNPSDQDAAFYVIYDCGRGRKHWAGGRYRCR
jgi:hypothetical protein